jgi:hypothetical protein
VHGTKGLQQFNLARIGPVEEGDPFHTDEYFCLFNSPNRGAKIKDSVRQWMEILEESAVLRGSNGVLTGLLNLIKTEVLIVNPNQRIRTKSLTDRLESLARIARSEAAWKLPPRPVLSRDASESAATLSSDSAPYDHSITQELTSAMAVSLVEPTPQSNNQRPSLAQRAAGAFRRASDTEATASSRPSSLVTRAKSLPTQIIEDRYIDEGLLRALLEKLFGAGQYRVQVRSS